MEETGTPEAKATPAWLRPAIEPAAAERHHVWAPRPLHRSIAWSPTGDIRRAPDGDYEVFVKQRALESMYRHVLSAHRADEPFGFLFGDLCEDRDSRRRYVVISRVVRSPYPLYEGESGQISEQALRILRREKERNAGALAGWYHRHRDGAALLTEEDEATHRAHFGEPWQVALLFVTDPERPSGGCFQPRTYGVTAHQPLPFHEVASSASLRARGVVRTILDWDNYETETSVAVEPLPRPLLPAAAPVPEVEAAVEPEAVVEVETETVVEAEPELEPEATVEEVLQEQEVVEEVLDPAETADEPGVLGDVPATLEAAIEASEDVPESSEEALGAVFELGEVDPPPIPEVAPDSEANFEILVATAGVEEDLEEEPVPAEGEETEPLAAMPVQPPVFELDEVEVEIEAEAEEAAEGADEVPIVRLVVVTATPEVETIAEVDEDMVEAALDADEEAVETTAEVDEDIEETSPESEAQIEEPVAAEPDERPLPSLSDVVPIPAPVAAPMPPPMPDPVVPSMPDPVVAPVTEPEPLAARSVPDTRAREIRKTAWRSRGTTVAEILSVIVALVATAVGTWPLLSAPPISQSSTADLASIAGFVLPGPDPSAAVTPFDDADPLASDGRILRAAIGRYATISDMFDRGRLACPPLREASAAVSAGWTDYGSTLRRTENRSSEQAERDLLVEEEVQVVDSHFEASGCSGP